MPAIDYKKELKQLYAPSAKQPELIEVPPMHFLVIDGRGDPNTAPEYVAAVETLYALAYALKFMVKRGPAGVDFAVLPLEGLWWGPGIDWSDAGQRDGWQWTMMIMQPEYVTSALFEQALAETHKKKPALALDRARFERYDEGLAAQIMHLGPYAAEGPTIARLHAFIEQQGRALRGKHHEIYLGDPRKTAPEKLRTVIRQPVG
ncbi:MAG TPA: GyrI-like domain-containing protein [Roseiflexaceae bacterium]|nr:GyrI-like domain-containing protein [Roseiflexaceae bacterium]